MDDKKHIMRFIVKTLLFLLILPYALTPLYRFMHPPSTLMLADWLTFSHVEREWVPIEKISPSLISAVVSAEDSAFCAHWGFDFRQMEKSINAALTYGHSLKATSTISQQLAKNLFLWHGRSWIRKGLEAPLTLWLELTWSKKDILEAYLNVAEWEEGIYGAEAAARHHFKKSAASLTTSESALLATSLPNPISRDASSAGPTQRMMAQRIARLSVSKASDLSCIR
jgi:monofunctional biosynthetic peptidoglycan transglycosylase